VLGFIAGALILLGLVALGIGNHRSETTEER
jgi:hypothetical protein